MYMHPMLPVASFGFSYKAVLYACCVCFKMSIVVLKVFVMVLLCHSRDCGCFLVPCSFSLQGVLPSFTLRIVKRGAWHAVGAQAQHARTNSLKARMTQCTARVCCN